MRIITWKDSNFKEIIKKISEREFQIESNVEKSVREIIKRVKEERDDALKFFSMKYDNFLLNEENFEVRRDEIKSAEAKLSTSQKRAIKIAARRIKKFHMLQLPPAFLKFREGKNYIKKVFIPLNRIGVYVPGGKASYPSTVLMNVIPAKVAGVKEIVMVTPPGERGEINSAVLYAARLAGVNRIFRIGGAHAIAALCFGTERIPKVDKIFGPGNIFVATAKKILSGLVGTDIFAGPSELLIIADETAYPSYIAADLLSQAEHDELALTICLSPSRNLLFEVKNKIVDELRELPTRDIASVSIANNCYLIHVKDLTQAAEITNEIAPEHVEVITRTNEAVVEKIRNAGTIFIGEWTPEPIGDYIAGSNHVLPTGGTARFSSGLSVLDFYKSTNIIFFTKPQLKKLYLHAAEIARIENLPAHERSLRVRFDE